MESVISLITISLLTVCLNHQLLPAYADGTELSGSSGSDHGQTGTQSSNTATNTAISPGGEVHSGQVAKDITKPPGESAQSNEPVVEAAVKPKAPAVDAPAPAAIETEPVQPPAEAAGKLSPPEADVATQQSHQQSTEHPPSPAVINTANQPSQPAADPVVNLQPAVEPVADRDSVPSQRESVDHLELQTESADSSSDNSSDKLRTSAQHDDQHSASDVGRSQSNSESDSVPVADDDVAKQHLPGEHTEQPSEQLTEPEPSDRDDSQQRNTNADEFPRESDDSVDKEQSQHTDESDHLANVDVILPASEESEKSSEQLTPSTNEPASDLHDSQQRKIDTTDVHAEPDDLSDELATSGNVQMHLKEAEHEGKAEAVADEQTSAAGDKGSVGGYFAWAAVDAWLMTCIDSMPLSMQKLFTNAPMSLSPQHSLLLFVSACFTLCMITVSLVFQCIKQWSQVQDKLDVCDRLYAVENARLVAEQENEDLHRELDLVNTRLREIEAQSTASGPEIQDLIAERDELKATIESQLTEVSDLQSSLAQKTDELTSAEQQVELLQENLSHMTEHTELIESQMLELQSALQHSQSGALEMQSQLQSMTEEISILRTSKVRLVAEAEGCSEKMQDMAEQITSLTEAQRRNQDEISLKERELDELCQCFYQLKSFEAELVDASEKSDEDDADDDDDAEGISSCDHEDADQQPNDDSVAATDNIAQQTASAKHTRSQAARDAVQEKIKDMMNVAHINATLKSVEEECESLRRALSVEIDGRKEVEGQLKDAEVEIAKVMQSRQEAEQQNSASKVKMEVLSNYFKDKEKELMRKLTEQEAREKASTDQLANTDVRTKEFENMVHLYKEQVEDLQKEIQKIEADYRRQIAAQEKKAHENWMSARQTERQLKEQKSEAQLLRQKITELQGKLDAISAESLQTPADVSNGSNVPTTSTPATRRPFPPPLHDGFLMRQRPFRPIPPPPPPLLDGRPLPPGFPDMCFTPPRLPPPMMDRRYPDERSLPPPPLPFEPPPWLPPPLPGGRSPPHMDRYSPRDGDRSPSSFHSSIPASGSSASLNRTNVASTPSSRSQVMSPPHLVDRGPPHVARPQPEFGIPSSRGLVRGNQLPAARSDEQTAAAPYRSYSPP